MAVLGSSTNLAAGQSDWPIFPCRQGALLIDPNVWSPVDSDEVLRRFTVVKHSLSNGHILLPLCRAEDDLLPHPPLGLGLSEMEARDLVADTVGAAASLAATDVGPSGQEKASNQDFALAATMSVPNGRSKPKTFQFLAVADGVTTRTFWPERAARLAVFAAWRAARRHVLRDQGFSHAAFEVYREDLTKAIKDALRSDQKVVRASKIVPPGWAQETYEEFIERDDLWYNTTLSVVIAGDTAAFVVSCGDGGLVVRKTEGAETKSTVLVHSTSDLSVSGIVSLNIDQVRFSQTRVSLSETSRLEVLAATDGVDRSLRVAQKNEDPICDPYGSAFSSVCSSSDLLHRMTSELESCGYREMDNASIAVLRVPGSPVNVGRTQVYKGPFPSQNGNVGPSGESIIKMAGPASLVIGGQHFSRLQQTVMGVYDIVCNVLANGEVPETEWLPNYTKAIKETNNLDENPLLINITKALFFLLIQVNCGAEVKRGVCGGGEILVDAILQKLGSKPTVQFAMMLLDTDLEPNNRVFYSMRKAGLIDQYKQILKDIKAIPPFDFGNE